MNPRRGGWLIGLSVIAAMLLALMRLPQAPEWLGWLCPDWGVVVFFFWTITAPTRTGVVSAWLAGFFFDVLLAAPLGLHGVGFAIVTYLAARFQPRLAMYTLPAQAALLAVVAAALALLKTGLHFVVVAEADFAWTAPLAGLGAMLTYPLLRLLLHAPAARYVRP